MDSWPGGGGGLGAYPQPPGTAASSNSHTSGTQSVTGISITAAGATRTAGPSGHPQARRRMSLLTPPLEGRRRVSLVAGADDASGMNHGDRRRSRASIDEGTLAAFGRRKSIVAGSRRESEELSQSELPAVLAGVNFPGMPAVAGFDSAAVTRAVQRLKTLYPNTLLIDMWLTQREFTEAFTDLTVFPPLTLPQAVHGVLAVHPGEQTLWRWRPPPPTTFAVANAAELVGMILLFGGGLREARGDVMMEVLLTDAPDSAVSFGTVVFTTTQWQQLVSILSTVAVKLGIMSAPTAGAIAKEASPFGLRETMTEEETKGWIHDDVITGRMLERLRYAMAVAARTRRQSHSLAATLGRARSHSTAGDGDLHGEPAGTGMGPDSGAGLLYSSSCTREQARAARVLQHMSASTLFSVQEIRAIRHTLMKFVDNTGCLPWTQFREFLSDLYPQATELHPTLLASMFREFNTSGGSGLDLQDVIEGLSLILRGHAPDKCAWIFRVMDDNKDGVISFSELQLVLNSAMAGVFGQKWRDEDYSTKENFVHGVVVLLTRQQTGRNIRGHQKLSNLVIKQEQFMTAILSDPSLLDFMLTTMVPGVELARPPFRLSTEGRSPFSLSVMYSLFSASTSNDRHRQPDLTITQFRRFFLDEFHCQPCMLPFINRMFHMLDTDHSGRLNWQEIYVGLSQVLGRGPEQRARFYFRLYDENDNGTIETQEIMKGILIARVSADQTSTGMMETQQLIANFDADGDGSISLEEFISTCMRDPRLLECFGQLFGDKYRIQQPTHDDATGTSGVHGDRGEGVASTKPHQRRSSDVTSSLTLEAAQRAREDSKQHIKRMRKFAQAGLQAIRKDARYTAAVVDMVHQEKMNTRAQQWLQQSMDHDEQVRRRQNSLPSRILGNAAFRAAVTEAQTHPDGEGANLNPLLTQHDHADAFDDDSDDSDSTMSSDASEPTPEREPDPEPVPMSHRSNTRESHTGPPSLLLTVSLSADSVASKSSVDLAPAPEVLHVPQRRLSSVEVFDAELAELEQTLPPVAQTSPMLTAVAAPQVSVLQNGKHDLPPGRAMLVPPSPIVVPARPSKPFEESPSHATSHCSSSSTKASKHPQTLSPLHQQVRHLDWRQFADTATQHPGARHKVSDLQPMILDLDKDEFKDLLQPRRRKKTANWHGVKGSRLGELLGSDQTTSLPELHASKRSPLKSHGNAASASTLNTVSQPTLELPAILNPQSVEPPNELSSGPHPQRHRGRGRRCPKHCTCDAVVDLSVLSVALATPYELQSPFQHTKARK